MKEFWTYTLLRVALFLASAAIVYAIWSLADDTVPVLWVVMIAFVVSGFGSYFVLAPQREAFALRVEERAQRASQKVEEMRAREDSD